MKLRTLDVSRCADIPPYVVRQYIDAGLLGPVIVSPNNYRWLDPQAVSKAYLWRTLQEMGFSMRQLEEFGQNRTPENALELVRDCDRLLETEISKLRTRQYMLQSYSALIREGQAAQPGEVAVRTLPAQPIHRVSLAKAGGRIGYEYLCQCFTQVRNSGCPLGYAWHDFEDLLDFPEQPTQMVFFDPKGDDLRPAGEYLVGTAQCCYGDTDGLPSRMLDYSRHNNLEFYGPAYTVYLLDAASVAGAEEYLLQIAVRVRTVDET